MRIIRTLPRGCPCIAVWLTAEDQRRASAEKYKFSVSCTVPVKGESKDLKGEHFYNLQHFFTPVEYIIIDEMSMVGRATVGQVDKCLCQVFPHKADEVFGGCPLLLFGDFGQLSPVGDTPLYTTTSRKPLSGLG